MKKPLTKASSKKKSPAKRAKPEKKRARQKTPRPIKFLVKKNGELETKEEREKRLAKKEALLLRMFQMAYDDYHNQ